MADILFTAKRFPFYWPEIFDEARQKDLWVEPLELSKIMHKFPVDLLEAIRWVKPMNTQMALSDNEKTAIKELHSKLSKSYEIFDFRVFGSKARGTDVAGSDIDIMILLEKTDPEIESEIDDLIFEINLKYDCLISTVFFSRVELEDGPYGESPIYKKAMAEGIRL